jgi:hypothetical protein
MKFGNAIVEFLVNYRIGTTRIFLAGPCAGKTAIAVEQQLSRGIRKGIIEAFRLYDSQKYYMLSREAARANGIFDDRAGMGLGFQALSQNYAMAAC